MALLSLNLIGADLSNLGNMRLSHSRILTVLTRMGYERFCVDG